MSEKIEGRVEATFEQKFEIPLYKWKESNTILSLEFWKEVEGRNINLGVTSVQAVLFQFTR